jgi:hypothetical protein
MVGVLEETILDGWGIQNPRGCMKVTEDDWIIRGVQGELYPLRPSVFEATYEKVEEPRHETLTKSGLDLEDEN